jgi:Na+/H+-dicarboxylate symporter
MNAQSAPNTNGTALLQGCVILFVAQAFGLGLALSQQVVALLLAVMAC